MDEPWWQKQSARFASVLKAAERRGYVTHDEIMEALPGDQIDPGMVEDLLTLFQEKGIRVVEAEDRTAE